MRVAVSEGDRQPISTSAAVCSLPLQASAWLSIVHRSAVLQLLLLKTLQSRTFICAPNLYLYQDDPPGKILRFFALLLLLLLFIRCYIIAMNRTAHAIFWPYEVIHLWRRGWRKVVPKRVNALGSVVLMLLLEFKDVLLRSRKYENMMRFRVCLYENMRR